MIRAAILTGETEHPDLPKLVQILHDHPDVELMAYVDPKNTGQQLEDLYPALTGETDLAVTSKLNTAKIDVVFLAAEPEAARNFMQFTDLNDETRVIDLSRAFGRPVDKDTFVQGIPELNRKALVRGATKVTMPDAVTTAMALSLLPLAKNGMLNSPVHTQVVTHDPSAESNSLSARVLDDEVARGVTAALTTLQSDFDSEVTGVEFVGDTTEGLIAVTTVELPDLSADEAVRLFEEFYDDHSFTFIVDDMPDITDARDTNKCFIYLDKKGSKLVVTTVMDTSLKGGAGNAVHAMNLLFGLLEKVGL